jgi:tetratricopeptide (TPR) repeat protein
VKDTARANQKFNFLAQVISLEKKIETLHITRSSQEKVDELAAESLEISGHIDRVTRLSNLALQLYRWYIKNGHVRNEKDEAGIKEFLQKNLPPQDDITGFYEKLYLYQSYCWYAFVRQDFLMYYRYSQKWIDLFDADPFMITVETGHYIKGMHNLLNAHFDLRNFEKFQITLKKFETYASTPVANMHDNFRTHTSIYINGAKLNWYLMTGTFNDGLKELPKIEKDLEEYQLYVDHHRIMVFTYKFATLYFGSGDYDKSIDYLQKIIHGNTEIRSDLQCYARVLHLMAHYELGNYELMESLTKSVYRFMAKMENLTVVEEEMFRFLRNSFAVSPRQLKPELEKFLDKIKHLESNRYETRSFAYMDIISWTESKVSGKPMHEIIYNKYLKRRKRHYAEDVKVVQNSRTAGRSEVATQEEDD